VHGGQAPVVHDDVVPLLQLRITLEDVEPGIWRLLEIGGDRTLSELHDALQIAVGWTDSHLHLFEHLDGRRWSDPTVDDETDEEDERTVRLDEVLGAAGLRYEYDFGDSWSHRIELIASTDGDASRVSLLDGARSAPPEDCGGVTGYAQLLAVLADPSAEDHDAAAGRRDPSLLLHHLAAQALKVAPKGVSREAGVQLLVELASGAEPARDALLERVAFGLQVLGYADEDRWSPPSRSSVSEMVREVWGLLGMLGLVEDFHRDPLARPGDLLRDFARLALQEA